MSSLSGSSDESVLSFVDGVDFEVEEVFVTESVGLPFQGFDFVGSFEGTGGDGEVVVGQDCPDVLP